MQKPHLCSRNVCLKCSTPPSNTGFTFSWNGFISISQTGFCFLASWSPSAVSGFHHSNVNSVFAPHPFRPRRGPSLWCLKVAISPKRLWQPGQYTHAHPHVHEPVHLWIHIFVRREWGSLWVVPAAPAVRQSQTFSVATPLTLVHPVSPKSPTFLYGECDQIEWDFKNFFSQGLLKISPNSRSTEFHLGCWDECMFSVPLPGLWLLSCWPHDELSVSQQWKSLEFPVCFLEKLPARKIPG